MVEGPRRLGFVLAFGVILPCVTIGVELVSGMCAAVLFDPLPTWGHVALNLAVPLAFGSAWWGLRAEAVRPWQVHLLGLALGVAMPCCTTPPRANRRSWTRTCRSTNWPGSQTGAFSW